jgi:FlaA1/EpsC-like NDP-sugar epimerase
LFHKFLGFLLAVLLIKPVVFFAFGMYRRYWQAASIPDLVTVVVAVSAASVVISACVQIDTMMGMIPLGFSRIVVFSDWLLTLVTTGGARVAQRLLHESAVRGRAASTAGPSRRVLIAGAGAAGTMVAREMRRNPQLHMEPIGFVDDDPVKVGKRVDGLIVHARTAQLKRVALEQRADCLVIAMPTEGGTAVCEVLEMAKEAGIKSQTIPGMFELLGDRVTVNRLRNVEDAASWESVFLKVPKETRGGNQPQDMILWKGLQLIGAGHRCLKG